MVLLEEKNGQEKPLKMTKKQEETRGELLFKEACKALGIMDDRHVNSWKYYPGEDKVVIVTVGGEKTGYQPLPDGTVKILFHQQEDIYPPEKIPKLKPERIDGVSRKEPRPITGGKAKARKG